MYAIRNKRTRKWLFGTDFRYRPRRQRTSEDQARTWETYEEACLDFKLRGCGKDYEIVPVRLEVLED